MSPKPPPLHSTTPKKREIGIFQSDSTNTLTILVGGGVIIILCWKIVIFPEPNLRWTKDQSVNYSRDGPMMFKNTFYDYK